MKLKMLLLPALLAPALQAEPFFSEYVEGSSSNKALEIYNPADTPLDLTDYTIQVYSNGKTTIGKTIKLSGQLAAKSVLVLVDERAEAALLAKQSVGVVTLGIDNFNGDDAIALYKNKGATLLDVIGQIGVDPGTAWGSSIKTLDTTLVRKSNISKGDNVADDAFDPALEWDGFATNTYSNLGSHAGGGGGTEPDPEEPVPTPTLGNCGDAASKISLLQGAGAISPELGKTHVIEAVVTQIVPTATGFFVQEEVADQDTDSNTSEAIFVYNNGVTDYPQVGNKVRIQGVIEEFFTKTQLKRSTALLDCGAGEVINAISVTLPISNLALWESMESMQVQFAQTLTVVDTYNLGTYGELTLANGQLFVPTNLYRPGTPEAVALADQNRRNKIVLDDLQNGKNPTNIIYPAPGLSMQNPVRGGDNFTQLQGTLDYSFSAWRLLPVTAPQFINSNPRTETPELKNNGSLKVASFNVLNYFNGNGDGTGFPTDRGATTLLEFERQSEKTVAALQALDADVVGLMEIENDGYGPESAIADLVAKLNNLDTGDSYAFVQVPGANQLGTDAITLGLIYKVNKVEPLGNAVTTSAGVFGFGNRQPLVQSFKEKANGEVFTLAVNHFKSKGSCPTGTTNPDRDLKDGQSCWNATRVKAANELMAWLATNPTGSADKDVLVIGDLNSYAKEDPIHAFVSNSFVDLIAKHQGSHGYGYVFSGESGYLDHALASTALSSQVTYATEWHINADEPIVFDYNNENKTLQQQNDLYAANQFRSSDHDPVIIELALKTDNPADFDKDGDVDNKDISLFNALLRSGTALPLIYDFNKDGKVNSLDARAMTALCTYARCAIQ